MRDLLGILGIVVALGVIVGIPLGIFRMTAAASARRVAVFQAWATTHGMTPSAACAVPADLQALYSGIVSFTWRRGALSIVHVTMRGETSYTFYWIAPTPLAAGPAYASPTGFGSGLGHTTPVVPTNDPAFDAAFAARATDRTAVPRVFGPELRAAMLAQRGAVDTVSWDGTRWSITLRTRDEDTTLWDQALVILETAERQG